MSTELAPPKPLAPGGLRVTALGGISEIGRNMTVFEHLGRLLIVDCGVLFPGHDEPGVDLILPDLRHVEDRLEDVEALVVTHAHEDHIGAIPYLLKLRPDIPVVGSKFTIALIREKCREHRIKPVFVEVAERQSSQHGVFECEYFAVNHSIPGCLAVAIHTGAGTVLHTGDIKLDQQPLDGRPTDLPGMSRLGDAGVDLFLCDSTNSEHPGVSPSESEVGPTLHRLIRGAEGRVIVACFASNVDRVQQIVDAAVALGRRVSFVGRSMVRNMGIARELGYLRVADTDILDIGAAEMMPAEKVVLITTGTQGEPMAALSRMSRGEHRSITLTAGDLIILSSSLIPGNEEAVYGVIDALAKIGARVVTNAQARVHVSGHAYAGELLFLYNGVRPRNVMPVHGTWRHMRANAALAASTGVPQENIVLAENGVSVDLVAGKASISGAVPVGKMFVDGLITGDVGDATLGERLILSSGFVAVTVVIHRETGKPAGPAHLHSRGFSEDPKALEPAARNVERELESLAADNITDPARIAQAVRRTVGKWVGETYRRQPMIVPTVIEI
ncbi:ribonuclease J [Mycolicibacterium fortuitum]|uniref:Ribonuclease J n=1 Tax=Mycolicibacterium fortuitum subsp. fortuitum DSM 46621 = ATCC 6841 = JCM 6387 TaxID=1214102 RepID=K0V6R9_MYCFO|nr:ribonuclease J [Mycolicibacterium fortuitum]AIY46291.1 Ribonuclease J2 (endoribonuclease in RNA processing) [Mycobacterium sp. VKM Ac-1817D]CRL81242.1 metallo-beta-lactamase superfamily protein [Mycolicibacter nonchromogenicus]AMD54694.1 ribonuclease J [Mycolicibacterium fortuitum subsp. fortuitum DSM 46621 = ATCC 6841 = JCM 6387]EJZ14736.1 metallo-beta-lactamase superfamily protein [Mycolicibacterium fortuitum subsp. fortuitum DSM 46621 = ATCC 6841 = JCM 6387]WEV35185.1 ribonuclease J [Myc